MTPTTMRTVVIERPGPPDVLKIRTDYAFDTGRAPARTERVKGFETTGLLTLT